MTKIYLAKCRNCGSENVDCTIDGYFSCGLSECKDKLTYHKAELGLGLYDGHDVIRTI